jgi:hypothetical protein
LEAQVNVTFGIRAGLSAAPEARPSFYSRFSKKYSSLISRNKRSPIPFCMVYNARPSRDAFIHCKLKKGETLMKTALVRILAIATLASSMSAFAATDEPKQNDAAAATTQQQEGCAAHKEKKQKKAKSQRDDQRTEQEKEFDQVLMGIYG